MALLQQEQLEELHEIGNSFSLQAYSLRPIEHLMSNISIKLLGHNEVTKWLKEDL